MKKLKAELSTKSKIHLMKKKVAAAQVIIAARRLELWVRLSPLIKHPADRRVVEMVLCSKNVSPRYW